MRDPSRPSFVGLTLGQWRFVFDYLDSSRVKTPDEDDKITPHSVPAMDNFCCLEFLLSLT